MADQFRYDAAKVTVGARVHHSPAELTEQVHRLAAGGPELDVIRLRAQLTLYAAVMGVTWLLDAPAYLLAALPDQNIDRFDPRIADNEPVRAQLTMLSNVLSLWDT